MTLLNAGASVDLPNHEGYRACDYSNIIAVLSQEVRAATQASRRRPVFRISRNSVESVDDSTTEYTSGSSEGSLHRNDLIESFAHHLLDALGSSMGQAIAMGTTTEEIAELLADFALRFSCVGSASGIQSAPVLIHKHRR